MTTIVRPGELPERQPIVEMLTEAFVTEVAMNYFFESAYDDFAPLFFSYLLDLRLEAGEVWVAESDGQIGAAAILNPPGGLRLSVEEQKSRWEVIAPVFPSDVRERFDVYQHRIHGLLPTSPHYYLSVIATHPKFQGKGMARAVLAPVFATADESGCETFLETASEENVEIYQRLDFEVAADVELPDGPLVRWMRRPAKSS